MPTDVPPSSPSAEDQKFAFDDRLKALETKVDQYEKLLFRAKTIVSVVVSFFGIGGVFLYHQFIDATSQLQKLRGDITSVRVEAQKLGGDVGKNPEVLKAAANGAEAEAKRIISEKLDPVMDTLRKDADRLSVAENTSFYDLVKKNSCYFYLESDVHADISGNPPFQLGMEKDRSLRSVVAAKAIAGQRAARWRLAISNPSDEPDCSR